MMNMNEIQIISFKQDNQVLGKLDYSKPRYVVFGKVEKITMAIHANGSREDANYSDQCELGNLLCYS